MTAHRYAPPKARTADIGDAGSAPLPWRSFDTPATRWLRRLAALTLAVGMFLPLARCAGQDDSAAKKLGAMPLLLAGFVVLAFFWPLLFEALGRRVDRLPLEVQLPWLRGGLAGCSLVTVAGLTCLSWGTAFGAELRYGAYVSHAAIGGYVGSLLVLLRRRRRAARVP